MPGDQEQEAFPVEDGPENTELNDAEYDNSANVEILENGLLQELEKGDSNKDSASDFQVQYDRLRLEQLKIEESVRLGHQAVLYQRENAQILNTNMLEMELVYHEQQREQREFEEQLEQESEERQNRAVLQLQQRSLLLDLESHQRDIHHLRANYRKAHALRREQARKRDGFNLKMEQRKERQAEESRYLAQAQERQARNHSLLIDYMVQKLSATEKRQKMKEQRLVAQHISDHQRREAEQLRETQSLQTAYLMRVFELETKVQEERNELILTHTGQVQRLSNTQELELRLEKEKVKARRLELQSLGEADNQRTRQQRLATSQKSHTRAMMRQFKMESMQREKAAKRELDAHYEEFLTGIQKKLAPETDATSEYNRSVSSRFSGLETNSSAAQSSQQSGSQLSDGSGPNTADELGDFGLDENDSEVNQARIQEQLVGDEQRITDLEEQQTKSMSDLRSLQSNELSTQAARAQKLKREASREMETQLLALKQGHNTQLDTLRTAQQRELENFRVLQNKDNELLRRGEEMRMIMGAMKDPMIVINDKGLVEVFNKSAGDMFKYEQHEVLDQNISMLVDPAVAPMHQSYIERYIQTGVARIIGTPGREVVGKCKDGTLVPLMLSITTSTASGRRLFIGNLHDISALKAKKVELAKVTEELQSILGATVDPIIVADARGQIELFNNAATKMFGYSTSEALGKNVAMLTNPTIREIHQTYIDRYLQTGIPTVIGTLGRETVGQHKNGELLPLFLSLTTETVHGRQIFVANIHDLRKIKKKELELHHAAEEMSAVMKAMKDPLIVADDNGIIQSINQAAGRLFEYAEVELSGRNVSMLAEPSVAAIHHTFIERYKRTGEGRIIGKGGREVVGRKKSGELVPLMLSVTVAQVRGRRLFIANLHDISLQKKREVQLSNASAELTAVLKGIKDGLVVSDAEGRIKLFNPAAESTFQYSQDEVLGKNVNILVEPRIREEHQNYIDRFIQTGQRRIVGKGREVVGQRKDGTLIPIFLTITTSTLQDQKIIIANLKDISEVKRSEAVATAKMGAFEAVASTPVIITDMNCRIELMTQSAAALFGLTVDDALGQSLAICGRELAAVIHTIIARGRQTSEVKKLEVQRVDGSCVSVLMTTTLKVHNSMPLVSISFDDQHSTKGTEEIRAVIAGLRDAVIVASDNGIIEFANTAACSLFQYQWSDLIGKNVAVLCPPDIAHLHNGYIERYKATAIGRIIGRGPRSLMGRRSDGTLIPVILSISTGGRWFIANIHDASVIQKKEQENSRLQAMVGVATSLIPTPFLLADSKGLIEMMNKPLQDLLGWTEQELTGQAVWSCLCENSAADKCQAGMANYMKNGKTSIIGTDGKKVQVKKKNGAVVPVHMTLQPTTMNGRRYFVANFRPL